MVSIKHLVLILNVFTAVYITSILFCVDLPSDPRTNPDNAKLSLFFADGKDNITENGTPRDLGLRVSFNNFLDSIHVWSECCNTDTTFSVLTDPFAVNDTFFFKPVFTQEGTCSLYVTATMRDTRLKDIADTLIVHVLPEKPGIHFVTVPAPLQTIAGKTDTLLFVTQTTGNAAYPDYVISSDPSLDSAHLFATYSSKKDSLRILFTTESADSYTVTVATVAEVNDADSVRDTAHAGVLAYGALAHSIVNATQTIVTGATDTLVFTVDNSSRDDRLTIQLVTSGSPDSGLFTVLPAGSDSLCLRLAPEKPESTTIGIAVSNGIFTDTTWYPITFIDNNTALWNNAEVAITAPEGKTIEHDMRSYFIKPQDDTVLFSSDIGTISDTVWKWTPSYGAEASASANITAKKGDSLHVINIKVTLTPGDTTKPELSLVNQTIDGKTISSSHIIVACIATDSEAGIGNVAFTCGSETIDASPQDDGTYLCSISDLQSGTPTAITITATDKSMNKNSAQLTFSVTYDSTAPDAEAPAIEYSSGPKNGDRVKEAGGTIIYTITDNSGVDSVWWKLNGTPAGNIEKNEDNTYSLSYTLAGYGDNTIAIFAKDGSENKNSDSKEVKLVYNTAPSAVTITAPANNEADVAAEPTFTWGGGTDADGDSVFYTISYGLEENSLTSTLPETKENSITIAAANKLEANTTYFWKVTAYTKVPYADTVESAVSSFKTIGTAPVITVSPKSISRCADEKAEFTIVATGTPTLTYQWKKGADNISGATSDTFTINSVSVTDSGSYTCLVTNGIGPGITSEAATLTVNTAPSISAQPQPIEKCVGTEASFSITASGSGTLTYQWKKGSEPISGATSAEYKISSVKVADSGKYSCVVRDGCGAEKTSSAATLNVNTKPSISAQPTSQTKWAAESATFTVSATGTGTLTYQWKKNGSNVGTNSPSLVVESINYFTDNEAKYSCDVTNSCGTVSSSSAVLRVKAVKSVVAGGSSSYFILMNDSLYACGDNYYGQLGDGGTTEQHTPVFISSDVATVAAGGAHLLILKNNGDLLGCGYNSYGQLGDGTTMDSPNLKNLNIEISGVAAGWGHSIFIKYGTAYTCGENYKGQLGNGTHDNSNNPLNICSNISSVAAEDRYTLLLKTDNTLWACGNNYYSQLCLGEGAPIDTARLVHIISNVKEISAGLESMLMLLTNGELWGGGMNNYGQLGDYSPKKYYLPKLVATDVKTMEAGGWHNLFVKNDGELYVIGANNYGQLGDGTNSNRFIPTRIMSNVTSVSAGSRYSLIIKNDGSLWACGENYNGQLGDGTTTDVNVPKQIKW